MYGAATKAWSRPHSLAINFAVISASLSIIHYQLSIRSSMILAFDYGTHKIGVASGNSLLGTATPLKALPCKNTQPNWDDIAALLKEWEPEGLVVGLPLNMDGSESESTARAKKFAGRLKGRFGMKVWLVDERLSTREARERTGIRQADSRVDSMAAVIIAEGFFAGGAQIF